MEGHSLNLLSDVQLNDISIALQKDLSRFELLEEVRRINTQEYPEFKDFGQVQDRIGEGAYGQVYATDKDYAVKIQNDDESYNSDILWECAALTYLDHPNIIKPEAICVNIEEIQSIKPSHKPHMVDNAIVSKKMYANLSLYLDHIKTPNSIQLIKSYAFQIAKAMLYYINQNLYHGDLKPDNLLIDRNGLIQIVDLGSCASFIHRKTIPRTEFLTTHLYRAPEIFSYSGKIDEKIDIWSYGCVLYEMFTRKRLFPGENDENTHDRIKELLSGDNLVSKLIEENFPPDLIDLLSQILVLNPEQRIEIEDILVHPFLNEFSNIEVKRLSPIDSMRFREVMVTNVQGKWFKSVRNKYYSTDFSKDYVLKFLKLSHVITLLYILEDKEVEITDKIIFAVIHIVSILNGRYLPIVSTINDNIAKIVQKLNWHILPTTIYDYCLVLNPDMTEERHKEVRKKIMSYYMSPEKVKMSPYLLAKEALE